MGAMRITIMINEQKQQLQSTLMNACTSYVFMFIPDFGVAIEVKSQNGSNGSNGNAGDRN